MTWGLGDLGLTVILLALLGIAISAWVNPASVAGLRRRITAVFGVIFAAGLLISLFDDLRSGLTTKAILVSVAIILTGVIALRVATARLPNTEATTNAPTSHR